MEEVEILQQMKRQRIPQHHFVKWWRIEDDFLDYDLIERFMENAGSNAEMAGFELLTMEEMWKEIQRMAGKRVTLLPGGDSVEWIYEGKNGIKSQVCTYNPDTLMTIFDVETKGNPVD